MSQAETGCSEGGFKPYELLFDSPNLQIFLSTRIQKHNWNTIDYQPRHSDLLSLSLSADDLDLNNISIFLLLCQISTLPPEPPAFYFDGPYSSDSSSRRA